MSETTKQRKRAATEDKPKIPRREPRHAGYHCPCHERLLLVGLADGSCFWLLNAHAKRTRTTIRIRTDGGIEIVVPAAGTDLLTYETGAKRPSSVVRLEEVIDDVRFALDERLWWTLDQRRRDAHLVPIEDVAKKWGVRLRLPAKRARKS